jgi:hypothetical protein
MVDVTLARAMWERNHGDDRVKALELARHARPAVAAGDEGNELAELDDWLARHR